MKLRTGALITATLLTAFSVAHAEEPQGWKVEITPMAWFAGIEGTVTVDGQETEFDKSASDLFDYVEFAGGMIGTVQYNRWVFRGQFDFFSLSTDALEVEDRPDAGKLDTDMVLTGLGAGYQIDGWMEGQTFDFLLALRSLHSKNDLEVFAGDNAGKYSKDSDLVDPMFSVRGSVPILPSKIRGLRLSAMASIGGGGDSDLVYELQPQIQYLITNNIGVRLGYRRAGWHVDSEGSGDELDFSLAGLNFGVGASF